MGVSYYDDYKKEYKKEMKIEGSPESIPRWKIKKIDEQLEKAICRIRIFDKEQNKILLGTCFLCKIPYPDEFTLLPVLITNNHIIDEKKFKENKEIQIYFNDGKITKKLNIDSKRQFYTSDTYDITIIEILPNKDDLHFFLEINEDENIYEEKNINIYVLHYPKLNESQVSYGFLNNITDEFEIEHTCHTEKGSSGAPILLLNTLKIIGIHKGVYINDKIMNLGTILKYPLLEFNSNNKKEIKEIKGIKRGKKEDEIITNLKKINKRGKINNEIIIKLKIDEEDLNKDVNILNDSYWDSFTEFIGLEELNKLNTLMYIDNRKVDYEKIKKFNKIGIYEIKLIIKINITDAKYMFINCKNIIDINLSKFDTKNVTDMERMFQNCINLKSLDLSSFDTKNVNNMKQMFSRCKNLRSLDLSSFDTRNVTDMQEMFFGCEELKSLDLSSFDTKNVTNMDCMFAFCQNIESLDLSSFDTKNLTIIAGMVLECVNLKSLDLSSFNINKVENMEGMLYNCKNLKNIDLSKFDTKTIFENPGWG